VSTVAVVVVVVGACIGVVTSMMTRTLEPATKRPAHERGPDPEPDDELEVGVHDEVVLDDQVVLDDPVEPVAERPAPPERSQPLPPGVRPPSIRAARALLAAPAAAPAPAAARVRRPRPRPIPRDLGVPHRPTRWWERLRSAVALTTVSVVLGLLAAVAVGVAMVALFSLLRSAVG
jgi:hypothetical protein